MVIVIIIVTGLAFLALEKLFPAQPLPHSPSWIWRVIFVNMAQAGIVLLAGFSWDRWFQHFSLFHLRGYAGPVTSALIAYFVSCFVYYWWHRVRHESHFFWRLCHQLHHSPRRIEVITSFYKHPVEITINSIISSSLVYLVLGCSVQAAAIYTVITAVAEFVYHWNIRTPRWIGYFFQRPESHRVHHQYQRHTNNYADLPIFDMLFGTFTNPKTDIRRCGFRPKQEARFAEMLLFRDVIKQPPLSPTCFGCRKRWICQAVQEEPTK